MNKIEIRIQKTQKISDALLEYGFSYNTVCKMLRMKDVRVDNVKTDKDNVVSEGQNIVCFCKELPQKKFEIVFEDENILIINKKSGIEVVGDNSIQSQIEGAIAVHRLDRNTEGLLIMAKNEQSEKDLLSAFKNHSIVKKYICEVVGQTNFSGKKYSAYLFKDSKTSTVKVSTQKTTGSVQIETVFNTIKTGSVTSIVECQLLTGKTHQIRAHLSFLGYPILGDMKYGNEKMNKKLNEKTQKLFCHFLMLDGLEFLKYLNGKQFKLLPPWAENIKALGQKQ